MVKLNTYINGIEISPSVFVVISDGDKWFKVTLPEGISGYTFYVQGKDITDAIDSVADFLWANKFIGLYKTYDQVWDEAEKIGVGFNSYEDQFLVAGNNGLYLRETVVCEEIK